MMGNTEGKGDVGYDFVHPFFNLPKWHNYCYTIQHKCFLSMRYICDFHIHSKYARACSPQLVLENIDKYCALKGVDIIGSGDFTHPYWFSEMKKKLIPASPGLYTVRNSKTQTKFICSTEIACIYSKGGRVRRLHILVLAPSLEVVEKINNDLSKVGKLASDGRPILGLDAKKLAGIIFNIDPNCMVIPAHAWTPWFAVFGSKSGFDSLEECFEEFTPKIYSIETGLSSDPAMNWRVSKLDTITLVSNSDAHSLPNIGREANAFEIDPQKLSYQEIFKIIKTGDRKRFLFTIEFYPDEGMYHWDGHRACGVSMPPKETKRLQGLCPKCKKSLTLGVEYRVDELADRPEGFSDHNAVPYKKLVELDKIIAESLNIKSRNSKAVLEEYHRMIKNGRSELRILLDLSLEELKSISVPEVVEGIRRVREGQLYIKPGFDGQYGQVHIYQENEKRDRQKTLF